VSDHDPHRSVIIPGATRDHRRGAAAAADRGCANDRCHPCAARPAAVFKGYHTIPLHRSVAGVGPSALQALIPVELFYRRTEFLAPPRRADRGP